MVVGFDMAVCPIVKVFSGSSVLESCSSVFLNYKQPLNVIGSTKHTPAITLSKLTRDRVELPEANMQVVSNALIIGDRLVFSGGAVLSASFLNNRVVHEAAAKRAKGESIDLDDKYLLSSFPSRKIDRAVWLCGQHGSYQHWFTEALPVLWLYKKAFDDLSSVKVIVAQDAKRFQLDVLLMLGFQEENIIHKKRDLNLVVDSLYVSDPLSLNSFWVRPDIRDAYNYIFSPYRKDVRSPYGEKIILGRKKLGNVRQVFNFDVLELGLKQRGYCVVYPEDMSFSEKITCFGGARRVVSLSGGGLSNIIFSQPGTNVLAISPDSFPINTFRDFSEIYGHNITYCLARSFLRFDDMNLNANSFIDVDQVDDVLKECWVS